MIIREANVCELISGHLRARGWQAAQIAREGARTAAQTRALAGKRPDFVLYKSDSDKPLAVIEAKAPRKDLQKALQQGLRYARLLGAPAVFATDGSVTLTAHAANGQPLIMGGEEARDLLSEKKLLHFASGNVWERGEVVKNSAQLIRVFARVSKILLQEGLQQMDAFVEFSQVLFIKIVSELEDNDGGGAVVAESYWRDLREKTGARLMETYHAALQSLDKKYQGVFSAQSEIQNARTLEKIIAHIDQFSFVDVSADVKGDAYEYFLRQYNRKRNELAQYFTPRHVVSAMVKLADPKIGEKVYDPFCGTGGMLVESFRHVARAIAAEPDAARRQSQQQALRQESLFGSDISRTAAAAKMNMILAGDGHSNISRADSLRHAFADGGRYHVVITNIPFSRAIERACVLHCLAAASGMPGGRVCMVLPERIVNAPEYSDLRQDILRHWDVRRVLSLPREVFRGFTTAKTSIIYAVAKTAPDATAARKTPIVYIDIKNDGFTRDKKRDLIAGQNDLDRAVEQRHEENPTHESHVRHAASARNGFSFSPSDAKTIKSAHALATLGDVATPVARKIVIGNDRLCREPAMDGKTHRLRAGEERAGYNVRVKKRLKILAGDLVFSKMHTQNGLFAFANDEYHSTGSHLALLVDEAKVRRDYLFWTLHFVVPLLSKTDTTGRESYSAQEILALPIPLPPLAQQEAIVGQLAAAQRQSEAAARHLSAAQDAFCAAILNPSDSP